MQTRTILGVMVVAAMLASPAAIAGLTMELDARENGTDPRTGSFPGGHIPGSTVWWGTQTSPNAILFEGLDLGSTVSWVGAGTDGDPYALNHVDNGRWGGWSGTYFHNYSGNDTTFTIEAWVKPTVSNSRWIIGDRDYNNTRSPMWGFQDAAGGHTLAIAGSGWSNPVVGSTVIPTGSWVHIATVVNSAFATHYVNTVADPTSGTTYGDIGLNTGLLTLLGKNIISGGGNDTDPFKGDIAIVRFYDDALSAQALQASYDADLMYVTGIPEPGTLALLCCAAAGLVAKRRRA